MLIGPTRGAAGSIVNLYSMVWIPPRHDCMCRYQCTYTTSVPAACPQQRPTSAFIQSIRTAEECNSMAGDPTAIFRADWPTVVKSHHLDYLLIYKPGGRSFDRVPNNVCMLDTFLAVKTSPIRQRTRFQDIALGKLA